MLNHISSELLQHLATVRPWGSILLGTNVRCDGEGKADQLDRRIACFSHIHEDHTRGFDYSFAECSAVITSQETKDLLTALYGPHWLRKKNNFVGLEYNKPCSLSQFDEENFKLKDETVTLFTSNHILGSSQILVENKKGKRILYSSDFNMPGTPIVKDVDILVLDATHGEPRFDYEIPRENLENKLFQLVEEEIDRLRPVILRSSRGKMQYLMYKLRNKLKRKVPFVATDDDRRLSEVYASYGMPAGEIIAEENKREFNKLLKTREPYVRFYPMGGPILECQQLQVRCIRVGTPDYSIDETNMFSVNLTDHATYEGIFRYVKETNPKLVITDNSKRTRGTTTAIILAAEIRNQLDIEAFPRPKNKLLI